jgi:LacI family transcriptional regulator
MARNLVQPHKRMQARRRLEAAIRGRSLWGQRLAGEHELAAQLGVSRKTIRAALAELETAGVVERRVGSGTFVARRPGNHAGRPGRHARLAVITGRHAEAEAGWSFDGALIQGVLASAPRLGAECQVLAVDVAAEREQLRDRRRLRRFDGFICVAAGDRELIARLVDLRLGPVVLMDEDVGDLPVVAVIDGSFVGARAVTRHLLGLGHRRIAFLNCHHPAEANPEKAAGYRAALTERDLAVDRRLILEAPPSDSDEALEAFGERATGRLLELPEPPSAVLGFDDRYVLPVVRALQRRGLRAGKDLSVAGQGDSAMRQGLCDWLTSTRTYPDKLGAEAVRAALTSRPAAEGRTVIVPNRLMVRGSTRPPPAKQ